MIMKIVNAKTLSIVTALFLIMVFAFGLRSAGISHGVDQGYIYHPDTPKQIAAVQEYLDGEYYTVKGNLNYDGYPFFNSRLMELRIRLRGFFGGNMEPDKIKLFRQMRMQNVWLSTLAVLLTYLIVIGISKSQAAALLSAFLLAISPVDVVTCHYAMGDTAAAFFATATVLAAVWIYKYGNFWSYVVGGITLACAFASKYHGAAAGIAIAVAHVMRYPHPRQFFGGKSLLRILTATVAAIIMLPIAIPSLFSEPVKTFQNIAAFLDYTSTFKMSEELMQQSLPQRWLFGVTHNYPHFAYMLTGGMIAMVLLGTAFLVRKTRAILIVASLPAIYMFVGLPFKPLSHIEYHTLVSPCLFAIAAMILVKIPSVVPQRYRNTGVMLTTAVVTVVAGILFSRTVVNDFYFSQPDTRLLATEWVYHNLPPSFQVAAGHYSYLGMPPTVKTNKMGAVMLSSSFRPHQAPQSYALRFEFNLHDTRLELFRNPEISLYIHRSPWIKAGWRHPTFQTVPYGENSGIVSTESPVFNRDPLRHVVSPAEPLDLLVLSENSITNAVLILQTADKDAKIKGRVGSQRIAIAVSKNEAVVIPLGALKRRHPMLLGANLYVWKLSAKGAPVMATLAITPAEQAVALTQAGLWQEAVVAFESSEVLWQKHPALYALKQRAETECKRGHDGVTPMQGVTNIFETFGVYPDLFETAPAITVDSEQWRIGESPRSDERGYKRTVPIFVTPGVYTIRGGTGDVSVYQAGTEISLGINPIKVPFGMAAIELRKPKGGKTLATIAIQPNPALTINYYQRYCQKFYENL